MTQRPVKYSYTRLSRFENCPYAYMLRYELGNYPQEDSLSLTLGNVLHKAREVVSRALMAGETPDYGEIERRFRHEGWNSVDKSTGKAEVFPSLDSISTRYFEDWGAPDPDTGLTYPQKIDAFFASLPEEENDPDWRTIGAEVPFSFEYRPGALLTGFIDKVQQNARGELRIVDYKSSRKPYDPAKLKTPLQLYVYHLAASRLYPQNKPVEYLYDLVLLGQKQSGGSPGWLKRAETKLDKLFDEIEQCGALDEWKPKPSPLCYWCPYSATNPQADRKFNALCPYFSFWSPTDRKNFATNRSYSPDTASQAHEDALRAQAAISFTF